MKHHSIKKIITLSLFTSLSTLIVASFSASCNANQEIETSNLKKNILNVNKTNQVIKNPENEINNQVAKFINANYETLKLKPSENILTVSFSANQNLGKYLLSLKDFYNQTFNQTLLENNTLYFKNLGNDFKNLIKNNKQLNINDIEIKNIISKNQNLIVNQVLNQLSDVKNFFETNLVINANLENILNQTNLKINLVKNIAFKKALMSIKENIVNSPIDYLQNSFSKTNEQLSIFSINNYVSLINSLKLIDDNLINTINLTNDFNDFYANHINLIKNTNLKTIFSQIKDLIDNFNVNFNIVKGLGFSQEDKDNLKNQALDLVKIINDIKNRMLQTTDIINLDTYYQTNIVSIKDKQLKDFLLTIKNFINQYTFDNKLNKYLIVNFDTYLDNLNKAISVWKDFFVNAKSVNNINDIYQTYYLHLLNNDLRNYYQEYKNQVNYLITDLVNSFSVDNMFVFKYWYQNNDFKNKINKINELITNYSLDTWMVFDKKDSVNVSNYQKISPFIEVYNNGLKYDRVYDYMFVKLADVLKITNKHISKQDFTKKQLKQVQDNFHLYIDIVKQYLPTLINKNWDVKQKAFVLAKFLTIKNNYNTTNYLKNYHFLSMYNNEFSEFNCQGYAEFLYIAFDILGYKDIYFNENYFTKNNKRLDHVNFSIVLNNKNYVIDPTFADHLDNWKTNWNWSYVKQNDQGLKDNIFITQQQWIDQNNLTKHEDFDKIIRSN